jgi:hypothetical protein
LEPNSYTIKIATWLKDKDGGDRRELDISINEVKIKWGARDASPEEVGTAFDLLEYLEKSELSTAMSPWEREQIERDMKLGFPRIFYEWEMRDRFNEDHRGF